MKKQLYKIKTKGSTEFTGLKSSFIRIRLEPVTLFLLIILPFSTSYAAEVNTPPFGDAERESSHEPKPKQNLIRKDTSSYQNLQRLFTNASEREYIDSLRAGKGIKLEEEEVVGRGDEDIPTTNQMIAPDLYIKGVVIRRDGKHVVWSQDDNTVDQSIINDALINTHKIWKNGSVPINYDSERFRLKPGQIWSASEQKVLERHLYLPNFDPLLIELPTDTATDNLSGNNLSENNISSSSNHSLNQESIITEEMNNKVETINKAMDVINHRNQLPK